MIFLTSWALWLLGLGVVIGIVYFLKRQARAVPVSTLFLWQGIERSPKSSLRLDWTQLLGLFLQLLALGSLITGLAQPVIRTSAAGDQTIALIIDGSASMRYRAGPEGPTRHEKAVDLALQLLRANPAASVTAIQAQSHSVLLSPLTHDHAQIQRTLSNSTPTYQGDSPLSALISLLQSQRPNGFDRVVYFTDHDPPVDVGSLRWETQIVDEEKSQNLAITRFAVREHPNQSGYDLYLETWNSSDDLRKVPLEITADGQLIDERWLELSPHQIAPFAFNYRGPSALRFEARLVADADDWYDDNVRYASLPQPRPWKILWVGASNFYLERFLRLSGQADLTMRPSWDETISATDYDLILLHRTELPKPISGRFLLIQSGWTPWVTLGEMIATPDQAVEVRSDDPLLAGLDPKDWRLLRIQDAQVARQGEVLLTQGELPLLYIYQTAGLRLVYLGIDLSVSNLGLSVDFPILMYRLFSWLAPRAQENRDAEISQQLPVIDFEGPVRIVAPNKQSCQFPSEDSRCGLLEQPGFYEVTHNGTTQIYAANPPSQESRSLSSPPTRSTHSFPPASPVSTSAQAAPLGTASHLWPYLLLAAMLLLLLELLHCDRSLVVFTMTHRRRRGS